MCIAILNAKGVLSLKTFKTCWAANPDGAGLCYFDGEKIQLLKEMKSVKNFHKQYVSIRDKFPLIDIAVHFRIATHGRVNSINCHPFKVNKNTAFIHNGVISQVGTNPDFSDTYIFNETILKNLPSTFVKNTAILELLSAYIGYSKLVIISGENSAIVNEELGAWDGGNWYSNKSYLPAVEKKPISQGNNFRYGWDSFHDWDHISGSKSNKEEIAEHGGECECCREQAPALSYINQWAMRMCEKCCEEYKEDIY